MQLVLGGMAALLVSLGAVSGVATEDPWNGMPGPCPIWAPDVDRDEAKTKGYSKSWTSRSELSLRVHPNGRTELTIRREDPSGEGTVTRSYTAESPAGFLRQYGDLAAEHSLKDALKGWNLDVADPEVPDIPLKDASPFSEWASRMNDFIKNWKLLFPELPLEKGWPKEWDDDDPKSEMTPGGRVEARKPAPRKLGITVAPVSEALAYHLGLENKIALHIQEVLHGSVAEKAGLRRHDVIVGLDGEPLADLEAFRKTVSERLPRGFQLEIVRGGERQFTDVHP